MNQQDNFGNSQVDGADVPVAPVIPSPWPFWSTIGWSGVIAVAYIVPVIPLTIIGFLLIKAGNPQLPIDQISVRLTSSGLFLSIAAIVTAVPVIGLSVLFAYIRKNISISQYLALKPLAFRQILKWCLFLVIFAVCNDTLTIILGKPIVPDWIMDACKSAGFMPLLLFAIIVVAPVMEEMFFRGFLFKGLKHSKLGPIGATILTALVWSVLHTQYDIYGIGSIFAGGLLLGYARIKSGSIYAPLAMHALMNLIASIQALIKISYST